MFAGWFRAGCSGVLCSSLLFVFTSHAQLTPQPGHALTRLFDTEGTFTVLEGLDLTATEALVGYGTNIVAVNLVSTNVLPIGSVSNLPSIGFLKQRGDDLHIALAKNFSITVPYYHGVVGPGGFVNYGEVEGIFDAAVDGDETLYIMANPGGNGSKVFRFVPATTALVEVIDIGGFSGGITFDASNRLYVADQAPGDEKVLRFTPEQLAAGSLTAAHGEVVARVAAGYLAVDDRFRLYATTGFGIALEVYDTTTGARLRTIAVDAASNFSIGRIVWDTTGHRLVVIDNDYSVGFDSRLYALGYDGPDGGIPGTSEVFTAWAAAVVAFDRPHTNSGGYARDAANQPTTPGGAVAGRPATFDPEVWPSGNLLSLGNGGSVTLAFADPITDGPGPDFAVFENGFEFGDLMFAELAVVEVATTTNAWARFPVTTYGTNPVGAFGGIDARTVDGVAGKHTMEFGTPFDLAWLKHLPAVTNGSVDLARIAYVRITDVVGDGSVLDDHGRPVYDPYTNVLAMTDGFDLRGVGVIHSAGIEAVPMEAGAPALVVFGYAGRVYQVQESVDGITWLNAGDSFSGTGGVAAVTLPAGGTSAWYRIVQEVVISP